MGLEEKEYQRAIDGIRGDSVMMSLFEIRRKLDAAVYEIDEDVSRRQIEIIVKNGLRVYSTGPTLKESFSNSKCSWEYIGEGSSIVTVSHHDQTENKFYYNPRLRVFIEGEPVRRGETFYCPVTGVVISG